MRVPRVYRLARFRVKLYFRASISRHKEEARHSIGKYFLDLEWRKFSIKIAEIFDSQFDVNCDARESIVTAFIRFALIWPAYRRLR